MKKRYIENSRCNFCSRSNYPLSLSLKDGNSHTSGAWSPYSAHKWCLIRLLTFPVLIVYFKNLQGLYLLTCVWTIQGSFVEGFHCWASTGFPILALLSAAACLRDKRIPAALNQASAGSSEDGGCSWESDLGKRLKKKKQLSKHALVPGSLDLVRNFMTSATRNPLPGS